MERPRPWSDSEVRALHEYTERGFTSTDMARKLGRSPGSVRSKLSNLGIKITENAREPQSAQVRNPIEEVGMRPPEYEELLSRALALESENAKLKEQLTWAQKGKSSIRTGGTLTIRCSDHHIGDANHLISSCRQAHEKTLVLIEQYEPSQIQIIGCDDLVAGRGIYKNQDLDSAVSDPEEQCRIGAVWFYEYLEKIRKVTDAPIKVFELNGNHSYAMGHPLANYIHLLLKNICAALEKVSFVYCHDCALINLAHEGVYNVLAMHGFGHSKGSPNSPAFVDAVKDKLLILGMELQPHERPRRVLSGHTHWLSVGLERVQGLHFDTTGGWQRNTRVKLGMNSRPSGLIVYVSLPEMVNEILGPIEVTANEETYKRELSSPTLKSENYDEAARCSRRFNELCPDFVPQHLPGLVTEGRW